MPSGGKRKEETAEHRPGVTNSEFALFSWLRLHPKEAATYGIEVCDGKTTIGSMLVQTLHSQGMDVKWHLQVPNGVINDESTSNEKGAAFIKSVGVRPGARKKQLSERPEVAPPSNAAVLRKGVLPRVSFPLLAELSKDRQKRSTTARGNRIGPPNDVAFMQRRQLVDFVEKKLRCERHSKRLRFCATKSHQVGVCASWCFVCEQGCLLDLRTSKSMHGNDYELNALTNCGIVTCALSFARMEPFFRLLGVNPISTTDHYAFKADVEPILGAMAERSMAREHEHAVTKGDTDFFSIDGGFTAPRLAHGCTMPAMVEGGGIVAVVHKRLTDEGATSSNSLEILCYVALLACPRLAIYGTVVMDGCKALTSRRSPLIAARRARCGTWERIGPSGSILRSPCSAVPKRRLRSRPTPACLVSTSIRVVRRASESATLARRPWTTFVGAFESWAVHLRRARAARRSSRSFSASWRGSK
jgi:hypothetical protein